MEYKICKLKFKSGVHLGNGRLTDASYLLYADTLFSALCIEAVRSGGDQRLESLVRCVRNDQFKISNAFPYIGNRLFLPKPMIFPSTNQRKEKEENGKEYKKLQYISVENISDYLSGNLDPRKEREQLKQLGKEDFQDKVAIANQEKPEPYHVGIYYFKPNAGIYFLVGVENKMIWREFYELLVMVSIEGIGGRRSSGLGRFELEVNEVPEKLNMRLNKAEKAKYKMSLSICLPQTEEMEKSLDGAMYLLEKRSGFIASETYANTLKKKKDLFCFKPGSVFTNTFAGDVYDVSIGGTHPVYRYAKPFFMGVDT